MLLVVNLFEQVKTREYFTSIGDNGRNIVFSEKLALEPLGAKEIQLVTNILKNKTIFRGFHTEPRDR